MDEVAELVADINDESAMHDARDHYVRRIEQLRRVGYDAGVQ